MSRARRAAPSLVLAASLAACAGSEPLATESDGQGADAITKCPDGPTTPGIDVSHHQGHVDWAAVRGAGKRFAVAKVTEGDGFVDPEFAANWSGMKAHGLVRGAYHFLVAGSGTAQADHYLAHVHFEKGDLPPIVDVETTGAESENLRGWIDRVKAKTGRTPIIYSGGYWYEITHPEWFADTTLWRPSWDSCPNVLPPWSNWTFWQDDDAAHLPGVTGGCDADRFNGTFAELVAFANDGEAPPSFTGGAGSPGQVGRNKDGDLDYFAASGGRIVHRFQDPDWSAWKDLGSRGGGFTTAPFSTRDGEGRLQVFATAADDQVWHRHETAANARTWGAWDSLGGPPDGAATPPAVLRDADAMHVLVVGHDGALWHRGQAADGAWRDWKSLGDGSEGFAKVRPAPSVDIDGRLDVFVRGAAAGNVWHVEQDADGSGFGEPKGLGAPAGGLASAPSVANDADGHRVVVGIAADGHLYRRAQKTDGSWEDAWKPMGTAGGGLVANPAVARTPDGQLQVFATGADGALYHTYQDADGWSGLKPLGAPGGGVAGSPAVGLTRSGALEVFVKTAGGTRWHVKQKDGGGWDAFAPFGAP